MSAVTKQIDDIDSGILEEDRLRADVYDLLASTLRREPDRLLLAGLARLQGDDSDLGRAFSALAAKAGTIDPEAARHEYLDLFIGLGRGELVPFASYYITGFLNEKPLATLRDDMERLGIARSDEVSEPEDSIAALCEMMAGLIRGRFLEVAPVKLQRAFFDRHLAPWAGPFFSDLEAAKSADLYAPVGTLGRLFMAIERAAFDMEE